MKTIEISLSSISDIRDFVSITFKYDFEMDISSDRYVVDAKSLMGIISLDLSKPVTLKVYSEDCEEFLKELKRFMV